MAVVDLWFKGPRGQRVPSSRHGRGRRYRVDYTDDKGDDTSQSFHRLTDAKDFWAKVRTDINEGTYVDREAGRVTFREYAEEWRGNQVHAESTAEQIDSHFPRHVYPRIGAKHLKDCKHSTIQGLVRHMQDSLAPSTVEVVYRYVAAVFRAAALDGKIPRTPCVNITLPTITKKRIVPMELDAVEALVEAMPARHQALCDEGIEGGLRQGEAFGLEVCHIDFLRRTLLVEQQLQYLPGQKPFLKLPKSEKVRNVPVGHVYIDRLAAHLAEFPAREVEIVDKTGPRSVIRIAKLVHTTSEGRPWTRARYSERVWQPAMEKAELVGPTFHDLRHFYASMLIANGASVTQVQHRLGHATATETLNTYSHLWPDEDDRTRDIVDSVLRRQPVPYRRLTG